MLKIGDTVTTKIECQKYTVMKLIGQGGQGHVFLLEHHNRGKKALKWYLPEQSTEQQYNAILAAIRAGKPMTADGTQFIWPQDIIEIDGRFGYVMDLIPSRFVGYGDMLRDRSLAPTLAMRCRISRRLVRAYQQLHLSGYCYRDISDNNFLFDPKSGDIVICDNDNVGVEGVDSSQVLGTLEYMSPEVSTGKCQPGINSDLYSLAVLLFKFFCWHHPYHGMLEYSVKSWDLCAKRWLYGETPIFIFDHRDKRNRLPDADGYRDVNKMWMLLPSVLRDAFTQSFTEGIHNSFARLKEHDWEEVLCEASDKLMVCEKDNAENFYDGRDSKCWYCGSTLGTPDTMSINSPYGVRTILLGNGSVVFGDQVNGLDIGLGMDDVVGVVQQSNGKRVLLNSGPSAWAFRFGETSGSIECGSSIELRDGLKVKFSKNAVGTIFRGGGTNSV